MNIDIWENLQDEMRRRWPESGVTRERTWGIGYEEDPMTAVSAEVSRLRAENRNLRELSGGIHRAFGTDRPLLDRLLTDASRDLTRGDPQNLGSRLEARIESLMDEELEEVAGELYRVTRNQSADDVSTEMENVYSQLLVEMRGRGLSPPGRVVQRRLRDTEED
jgi:hypothetical protein